MGIPGFATWLINRYPLIKSIYHEPTTPKIDWFFIDMNSIIHKYASDSFVINEMIKTQRFEDVCMSVINHLNELTQLIAPKKLLFLAFDGVAPRAKMTTKRSRSFQKKKRFEETYEPLERSGVLQKSELCIKYATAAKISEFMAEIYKQIRVFIQRKMMEDERWRKINVIFSGGNVPGEGEHKAVDYIHAKAQDPEFDPNTSICFYGSDADLIILSLTTHLPFVCIIREQFKKTSKKVSACKRLQNKEVFEFVWINVLREYLEIEFESLKNGMGNRYDLEKIIDDLVFLLLFCGNDFLPRVSCVDIRKGYLDRLIDIFKETLVENNGYINEKAAVCWPRAVNLFRKIKELEYQFIHAKYKTEESPILEAKGQFIGMDGLTSPEIKINHESKTELDKQETIPMDEITDDFEKRNSDFPRYSNEEKNLILISENYRQLYYENNFKINVQSNPEALIPILVAYMEGIQYVLSYYYIGCISWVWFYPYYYPPLLFDLSNLLTYLKQVEDPGYKITFEKGTPSEPFKEFILIARTDRHYLLPEPLRNIVCSENSPLRQFYPKDYEIDPFGGLFEHEFIAKIPFVDLDLLDAEYNKIMKEAEFTPEEQMRNSQDTNMSYIWDEKAPETEVQSTLPGCFKNFKVKVRVTKFLTEEIPFDPSQILDKLPSGSKSQLPSYPSLHFIPNKESKIMTFVKKGTTFNKWCLLFSEKIVNKNDCFKYFIKEKIEYLFLRLLEQECHCMYPFLFHGKILGILTPNELITTMKYMDLPFEYNKREHKDYYSKQISNINAMFFDSGISLQTDYPTFVVVLCEETLRKDCFLNTYCPYPTVKVIPLSLIFTSKISQCPKCLRLKETRLEEKLPQFSKVIINQGDYAGSVAKVIDYSKDKVEVQVLSVPPQIDKTIKSVIEKYKKNDEYHSPESVADQLGLDLEIFLIMIDSLIVQLEPPHVNDKSNYPLEFDLGLNLIRRDKHLIVPELIICHKLEKSNKPGVFPDFLLSREAVQIIKEYFERFKEVFNAVQRKFKENDNSIITVSYLSMAFFLLSKAKNIFPHSKNPNLEVIRVHIWLFRQEISNLMLSNKVSHVLPKQAIHELQEVIDNIPTNHFENENLLLNPEFLIAHHEDNWISPFLNQQPTWHQIGDRIVNLKTSENLMYLKGNSFAPFGATGTVVGILGNKPENWIMKFKILVLFDHPFIGGGNLEGRCEWGRGAVVDFDSVFNLDRWQEFVRPFDKKNIYNQRGWDGAITKYYVPPRFSSQITTKAVSSKQSHTSKEYYKGQYQFKEYKVKIEK